MRITQQRLLLFLLQAILLSYRQILGQIITDDDHPILAVRSDNGNVYMSCTVRRAHRDHEVYFSCPTSNTHCYQDCKPIKACPPSSGLNAQGCVPDGRTVKCQKLEYHNDTVIFSLNIERTDKRLHGRWYCTHAGKDSLFYDVVPKVSQLDPIQERDSPPRQVVAVSAIRSEQTPPFRQPAVVFSILAILGLSLIINMAFCVRCVMMRSYIDSLNAGESAKCLAGTLCLPVELRKPGIPKKEPLLPRLGAWGSIQAPDPTGYTGSYQGSTQFMHQITGQPVFLHPHTYTPAGSVTGAYRTQNGSQPRLYGPAFLSELSYNPAMENAEAISLAQPIFYGNGAAGSGVQMTNGAPSFIRNPSIQMPSPNLSQRCYVINNPSPSLVRISTGNDGQPTYVVQQQPQQQQQPRPTVFGGHIVYDDVSSAAANQLTTGDPIQNEVNPYTGSTNRTAAKGFIPFAKLYTQQADSNQSITPIFPSSVSPQMTDRNTFNNSNMITPSNKGTINRKSTAVSAKTADP